tara:strand:- start:1422 stop:1748 length:327 start_codon:yes stop_codon:yes gene_type:complete
MAKTILALKPHGNRKYLDVPVEWVARYNRKKTYCRWKKQEWAFTPQSFYAVWKQSGVMHKISRSPSGYCMVRLDPTEAWSPKNVKIIVRGRLLMRNIEIIWRNTWGRT